MSAALRPTREAIVATAQESIARGSKSFALASRLFDRRTRERAWLLYAWCRRCDDLADGQVLGHAPESVEEESGWLVHVRTLTDAALAGRAVGDPAFAALAIVAGEAALPRRLIDAHIEGFALDAADWRPRSEEDLVRYCRHVAGVVGCMMAVLMGVSPDDEAMLGRACDLGIAFQLANIARDMSEDDSIGRCYLPQEWLAEMDVPPGQHMKPAYRERMGVLVRRLAALAERYEASGRAGAAKLPFRARWAVLAAANIYGAIAREAARRGPHAWDYRIVIGRWRKLGLAATALFEAARTGR